MQTPLTIGVIGTGFISAEFVPAVQRSGAVRIAGVASRDAEQATQFARRFGLERAYAGYQALLDDSSVDAVYIALPNSLHAEWTERAARAGKHILCEKPLAPTIDEAARMRSAARQNGVVLLEAYPYYFQGQTIEMLRCIEDGQIGAIRCLQASIGFTVTKPDSIRLNRDLAGGALLDAGCYCVSLARRVFGAPPFLVTASSDWAESGVDRTTVATLKYSDGGFAQIACSIAVSPHRSAIVNGSDGALETSFSNHTDAAQPPFFRLKRGIAWTAAFERIETSAGNGLQLEAEAFAKMVRSGDVIASDAYIAISLDNAATLEAILRSAREGQPVLVRPDVGQSASSNFRR